MLFRIIFLLSTLELLAQATKLAKGSCQDHCGNVSIPYTFGMGATHCYIHEWFAVDCKVTTPSGSRKPFLRVSGSETLVSICSKYWSYEKMGCKNTNGSYECYSLKNTRMIRPIKGIIIEGKSWGSSKEKTGHTWSFLKNRHLRKNLPVGWSLPYLHRTFSACFLLPTPFNKGFPLVARD
ncbi:Wall-associated receptor kinase-like 8 [Morella rubra]|uniref:Wall-associated receptor kinase-like 8 n=1 Tax=Morella rubra TaxID=262757 RepID=A0A6A1UHR2_9ROSI|nr:Wall-associated receptor kinase-like 8 [Morella rubra]